MGFIRKTCVLDWSHCVILGVKYIDECPVQKWIPIYLIVVGAGMLLMFAVTCCWNYYQMRKESIEKTGNDKTAFQ